MTALSKAYSAAEPNSAGCSHFDKLISMDFRDVENPDTHKLLNAVQQTSQWSSFGMRMVYWQFQEFLEAERCPDGTAVHPKPAFPLT